MDVDKETALRTPDGAEADGLVFRDEEGEINPDFVAEIGSAIEARDAARLRVLVEDFHESDLGDLLEALEPDHRPRLIELLGRDFDFRALTEVEASIREDILEELETETVVEGVRELDHDDAVYILEDLDEEDKAEILGKLPAIERVALQRSLEYPEDSAGRRMQTDLIAVPPFWTVGQTIDFMRVADGLPDRFSELYVVDPTYHLIGAVPLSRLLRSKRPVRIEDITETEIEPIAVDADQEEVARAFERYNLLSAPVVDENRRLVGRITVDDIVEIIQEEAQEDIHRLGGVGDEKLSDTVWNTTRSRFAWLLLNLATAILASLVISLFDATIEEMVALAVLMPIVASMGGNAATQTMTVAVRALATRDLSTVNAARIVARETLVGLINGLLFAVLMGLVAFFWFGSDTLGFVIAAAMVVNLLVAALAGILIPLALDAFDIDPAVASGVFVTTVTDVVGFFAFLGLAAIWLV
jgi:magnesium transporter